jgi:hypothetical protein
MRLAALEHGTVFIIVLIQPPDSVFADNVRVFIIHRMPLHQCEIIIVLGHCAQTQKKEDYVVEMPARRPILEINSLRKVVLTRF